MEEIRKSEWKEGSKKRKSDTYHLNSGWKAETNQTGREGLTYAYASNYRRHLLFLLMRRLITSDRNLGFLPTIHSSLGAARLVAEMPGPQSDRWNVCVC